MNKLFISGHRGMVGSALIRKADAFGLYTAYEATWSQNCGYQGKQAIDNLQLQLSPYPGGAINPNPYYNE
jgi:hypothetical protein